MSNAEIEAKMADLLKAAELFESAGRTHIPVSIDDLRKISEAIKEKSGR